MPGPGVHRESQRQWVKVRDAEASNDQTKKRKRNAGAREQQRASQRHEQCDAQQSVNIPTA